MDDKQADVDRRREATQRSIDQDSVVPKFEGFKYKVRTGSDSLTVVAETTEGEEFVAEFHRVKGYPPVTYDGLTVSVHAGFLSPKETAAVLRRVAERLEAL